VGQTAWFSNALEGRSVSRILGTLGRLGAPKRRMGRKRVMTERPICREEVVALAVMTALLVFLSLRR
jgi:hypothetical protein